MLIAESGSNLVRIQKRRARLRGFAVFEIVIAFFLIVIALSLVGTLIDYGAFTFKFAVERYGKGEGIVRATLGLAGFLGCVYWLLHRWLAHL